MSIIKMEIGYCNVTMSYIENEIGHCNATMSYIENEIGLCNVTIDYIENEIGQCNVTIDYIENEIGQCNVTMSYIEINNAQSKSDNSFFDLLNTHYKPIMIITKKQLWHGICEEGILFLVKKISFYPVKDLIFGFDKKIFETFLFLLSLIVYICILIIKFMKKSIFIISALLCIGILMSFKLNKEKPVKKEIKFTYNIDTLFYSGGLNLCQNTGSLSAIDIKAFNGSLYVFVKSPTSDTLYKFSYTDKIRMIDKYCLPFDYNNKSIGGEIKRICAINNDSILILQQKRISIFDVKLMKTVFEFNQKENWLNISHHNPIAWNYFNNTINTELINYDSPYKNGIYQSEIVASIDPKTKIEKAIPIKIPKYIEIRDMNLDKYFANYKNNTIIGFSTNPDVYIYNSINGKIRKESLKSNYDLKTYKVDSKNEDYDNMRDSFFKSFFYRSIFYDNEKEIIFRAYETAAERKDRLKPTYDDKRNGFDLYNDRFEPIGNILLKDCRFQGNTQFVAINGTFYMICNTDALFRFLKIIRIKYEI